MREREEKRGNSKEDGKREREKENVSWRGKLEGKTMSECAGERSKESE